MGMTMAQKILAKASGTATIKVGDVVMADLQVISTIDIATFDWVDAHSLRLRHPERIVICFDHFCYDSLGSNAASVAHPKLRRFAREQGIPPENLYDVGRQGISHHVPVEEGYVLPGTFVAGADTQAATMGAMNCLSVPLLRRFVQSVVACETWMVVPGSVRIDVRGRLRPGVSGKDVYLTLLRDHGVELGGYVLEYVGDGIASLPIDVRLAIANGSNHLGAHTSIFAGDQRLRDYLRGRARRPYDFVEPDADAAYVRTIELDLDAVAPVVVGPGSVTRIRPVDELAGTRLDAAYIGSCSSGRLEDLALAAGVLEGRRVNPGVRLVVTPISARVMREATDRGIVDILLAAGATVTMPGCGACFYGNQSPLTLADGEVCLSTSVENNAGRMGSEKAEIYLANAGIVAASALAGTISNLPAPGGRHDA